MAAHNFKHALFCAFITLLISYPILGFNLEAQGINIAITGADTTTILGVLLAAVVVFLFQLFRDQIMGRFGDLKSLTAGKPKEPMAENRRAKIESWVLTGIVVLALFWPFFMSRGAVDLATLVLIYIMLALGLNVVDAETRKGTINVEGTPSRTIGTKGNTMVNVTQRVVGGGRNPKKGMGHKRNYRDLTDEPSTTVAAVRIGNAGPWICDVREAPEEPDALTGTREKWRGRPAPTVVASEVKGTRATPGQGYRFNGGPDRASDALWLATAKPDTDGKLVGRRRLTIAEVALLQWFPADWQFSGTKTAQYAQVGNAVPPKMAEVVGRTIIEEE